jgi:hypothetical protein
MTVRFLFPQINFYLKELVCHFVFANEQNLFLILIHGMLYNIENYYQNDGKQSERKNRGGNVKGEKEKERRGGRERKAEDIIQMLFEEMECESVPHMHRSLPDARVSLKAL